MFDAREALYSLRNEYPRRAGRFTRIRVAILQYRAARARYKAAAEAFHTSSQGLLVQRLRQKACRVLL